MFWQNWRIHGERGFNGVNVSQRLPKMGMKLYNVAVSDDAEIMLVKNIAQVFMRLDFLYQRVLVRLVSL